MISLTSPVKTRAHDWPAGLKLAGLCASTLGLFYITSPYAHLAILLTILAAYAAPGRAFLRSGLRALKVLWPFIVIVGIWQVVIGEIADGLMIVMRMISAVALANLVSMTTRLSDMIAVVSWLSTPLRKLGMPTQVLEIAIALVIRMVPVLMGKGTRLTESWRARATRRPSWRLVLPFTLLALDDADHVGDALRARGGLTSEREN
ncbi:MAG: energy-coupling factor transporter transmembrane protein EcfT [Rhodobacteraceae bacterium]|jgi:ABC-type cobalt transport system, permease component CbiQ and related transporters|uniref:ABC transporter permease n=1 Tax=Thioclava marina TaxID=1915077 RepID=A0ABX3MLD2_9RHOB|nr:MULTISPECIES: energy-coupling factor transporter transmembrane protein EcfT [Thioclava]MBD3802929.1 energy-coupling factor transporter transmembrane protein EcfT [Thioclava sp.]OOY12046.1 ABC transporter permease [Thioclava marina]TNF12485.1 MAG: energy-coupling factor transporter transmembrane protein EcfT [Paracoccaceae bacterium]